MSIILVDTFHHLSSSHCYTKPLEHYSVQVSQPVSSLFVIPLYFKTSSFIIISKPNKISYNSPKTFRPIILLNTLSKLIEKVIGKRLQFQSISMNVIYPCQLGRLKQQSIMDTGIVLTCTRQVKNLNQYFSVQYCLILSITQLSITSYDLR